MIDSNLSGELLNAVEDLSDEQRRLVVQFARSLSAARQVGAPGANLLRFAGTLPDDAAVEMIDAIETGCERIDVNEW